MAHSRVSVPVPNSPLILQPASDDAQRQSPDAVASPTGTCCFVDVSQGNHAVRCGCQRYFCDELHVNVQPSSKGQFCMCGHHSCFHSNHQGPAQAAPAQSLDFLSSFGAEGLASLSNPNRSRNEGADIVQYHDTQNLAQHSIQSSFSRQGLPMPSNFHQGPELYLDAQVDHLHERKDNLQQLVAGPTRSFQSLSTTTSVSSQCNDIKSGFPKIRDQSTVPPVESALSGPSNENEKTQLATQRSPFLLQGVTSVVQYETLKDSINCLDQSWAQLRNTACNEQHSFNHDGNHLDNQHRPSSGQEGFIPTSGTPATAAQANVPRSQLLVDRSIFLTFISRLERVLNHFRSTPNLHCMVQELSTQFENFQNSSFNASPTEDVVHKVDMFEGKLLEIESKVEDLANCKKFQEDQSFSKGTPCRSLSSANGRSFSPITEASGAAHTLAEISKESHNWRCSVEDRLLSIESHSLPSPAHPWLVNVVIFPWGRDLSGAWAHGKRSSLQSQKDQLNDEWTQANSLATMPQNAENNRTSQGSEEAWKLTSVRRWNISTEEWMQPKAFDSSSKVYRRLKSRGLVGAIKLTGSAARDVEKAIESTFGNALDLLNGGKAYSNNIGTALYDHQPSGVGYPGGLFSRFIPLRKIRSDSTLHFLAPKDLASGTLWNAQFLQSDVMMNPRRQLKTLFLTTRDGYLQHHDCPNGEWDWNSIKALSLRVIKSPEIPDMDPNLRDEDLIECWNHDQRLDPPKVVQPNFSAHLSYRSSQSSQFISSQASEPSLQGLDLSRQPSNSRSNSIDCDNLSLGFQSSGEDRQVPISPKSELPRPSTQHTVAPSFFGPTTKITKRPFNSKPASPRKSSFKRRRISSDNGRSSSPFFDEADSSLPAAVAPELRARRDSSRKRAFTPTAYNTPYSGIVGMRSGSMSGMSDLGGLSTDEFGGFEDEYEENLGFADDTPAQAPFAQQ